MRVGNLRAKAGRKYRITTQSEHVYPIAPNTLNRQFDTVRPNEVWVGDITYLWTSEGWMYLAVFIDLFSRMVVGWSLSNRLTGSVVHLAFERACARRSPTSELLIHTDRGCQYAATAFREILSAGNISLSMSRKANCWDNAVAESFFHSFKVEAIHGEIFENRNQLEFATFDYIERYYNRRRRHSTIQYLSPEKYEMLYNKTTEVLAA